MINTNKFQSIRVQLVILLSLSAMIGIFLFSVVTFIYNFNKDKNNALQSLSQLTSVLAHNLSASVEFDDEMSAKITLDTLKQSQEIKGAFVYKGKPNLFISYTNEDISKKKRNDLSKLINFLKDSYDFNSHFEYIDFNHLVNNQVIYLDEEPIASFILVTDTNSLKDSLYEQLIVQLLVSIAALFIIIFLANILQKKFTDPIFKLKETMEYVGSENTFDINIEHQKNDEFKSLYLGFTKMLQIINRKQQEVSAEMAERIKSEHKAEDAKQRLENITNSIPGVVYQFQVNGDDVMVNFISHGIKQSMKTIDGWI